MNERPEIGVDAQPRGAGSDDLRRQMKTKVFKQGDELVVRVTVSGKETDYMAAVQIAAEGPGLCRFAKPSNCRPLFESPDRTYEVRVPAHLAELGDDFGSDLAG